MNILGNNMKNSNFSDRSVRIVPELRGIGLNIGLKNNSCSLDFSIPLIINA